MNHGYVLVAALIVGLAANAAHADNTSLGGDAVQLTGDDLFAAVSGRMVEGEYEWDGDWRGFSEHYKENGKLYGENTDPGEDYFWRGEWEIIGDEVCFDYERDDDYCLEIWRDGDVLKGVQGGDVTEWHRHVN